MTIFLPILVFERSAYFSRMSDPSASVEPVEVKKSSIDEEWLSQDCLRRLKEKLQVSLKQAFRKLAKVLFGLFSDVKKV